MKNQFKAITFILIHFMHTSLPAQDISSVDIQFNKLSDHLYYLKGGGANVIASIGEDGLLLVETKLPALTDHIQNWALKHNNGPLLFVIDTHYHPDHVIGNKSWFQKGAVIISHENARSRMSTDQYSSFWDDNIPAAENEAIPVITFQKQMTLFFNGEEMRIIHIPGHTDGDAVVYFRKDNVIHIGDLVFNGTFPNADFDDGGSINQIIEAGNNVLNIINRDTRIVVGHGQIMTKKELEECILMMTDIRNIVLSQIESGNTLDQVIASKPTLKYEDKWEYGSLKSAARYIEYIYQNLLKSKNSDKNEVNH
ncbi:MBL fold metallo-hydrolase [candidate division KSB1 bacterium]